MATQYTIKYNGWNSTLKTFGTDYVFFKSTAFPNDNPHKTFPVFVSFLLFLVQAEEMFPGITTNVIPPVKSLSFWHLPESAIVHEMEELGIDFESIVLKAIATKINLEKISHNTDFNDPKFEVLRDQNIKFVNKDMEAQPGTFTVNSIYERIKREIADEAAGQIRINLN